MQNVKCPFIKMVTYEYMYLFIKKWQAISAKLLPSFVVVVANSKISEKIIFNPMLSIVHDIYASFDLPLKWQQTS